MGGGRIDQQKVKVASKGDQKSLQVLIRWGYRGGSLGTHPPRGGKNEERTLKEGKKRAKEVKHKSFVFFNAAKQSRGLGGKDKTKGLPNTGGREGGGMAERDQTLKQEGKAERKTPEPLKGQKKKKK